MVLTLIVEAVLLSVCTVCFSCSALGILDRISLSSIGVLDRFKDVSGLLIASLGTFCDDLKLSADEVSANAPTTIPFPV